MGVAPETKSISEGYAASLAFLSHIGNWLPDYTYQTAELSIRNLNAWQAFSGMDAASFKVKTGSHVSVKGINFIVGAAIKFENVLGALLFGAFVEGGVSSYDVHTDVVTADFKEVGGGGHMRSLGVGIMLSQKIKDRFRFETSFRYGKLQNTFTAVNYQSPDGTTASFKMNVPYMGGHVGLGYTIGLGDFGNIDLSARYYLNHVKAQELHIGTGAVVSFDSTTSKRFRVGARFTKPFTEYISGFAGAYFDREFDNMTRGRVFNMELQSVGLKGTTGVYELGAAIKSATNKHLSIEFGIQGYTGVFKGLSGGVRLGVEF